MKNLLLVALVATVSSCGLLGRAREQAVEHALEPAVVLAWGEPGATSGVRSDVVRGIADAVEDGDLVDSSVLDAFVLQMDAALADGGQRSALRVIPWDQLRPYGERGIQDRVDDGEIDPLIAPSLLERLSNFSLAISELVVIGTQRIRHDAPALTWNGRRIGYPDGSVQTGSTLVTADGNVHTVSPVRPTSTW